MNPAAKKLIERLPIGTKVFRTSDKKIVTVTEHISGVYNTILICGSVDGAEKLHSIVLAVVCKKDGILGAKLTPTGFGPYEWITP